tara:strand:+ start:1186 stop:1569 length:384 start_codon:yes stop_codon:yes gene_type:complete
MRIIILFIFLFISTLSSQEIPEMKVYTINKKMKKGYRVFKTTITDSLLFKQMYEDSDYTLDYVLRYYYSTAIDLSCKENELISMSGKKIPIQSKEPNTMVYEVMELIGNMYYGKSEHKEFNKKYQKD